MAVVAGGLCLERFHVLPGAKRRLAVFLEPAFGPERLIFLQEFESIFEEGRELLVEYSRRLIAAGVLRPGCEDDFGLALHGMIDAWHRAHIIEGVELNRELAERIVDILLFGFGTR